MINSILEEKLKLVPQTKTNIIIAQYLIDHKDEVLFMNTSDIANAIDISDVSVLRFVRALGYKNLIEFKNDLKSSIADMIEQSENMMLSPVEKYLSKIGKGMNQQSKIEQIVHHSYKNIQKFVTKNSEEEFDKIVDTIIASRNKFVVGFRENAGTVEYLGDFLCGLMHDVIIVTEIDYKGISKMLNITKDDCIILISFKRYARPAYDFFNMAKEVSAKTIAITDFETSPFAISSDLSILCSKESGSFFGSSIAQTMAIEIILAKIGTKMIDVLNNRWKKLDEYLVDREIY